MISNQTKQPTIGDYLLSFLETQGTQSELSKRVNGFDFLFENVHFSFVFYPDPNYFRIILPISGVLDNDATKEIIKRINEEVRVVKAVPKGDNKLWLVAEQYVYSENGIYNLFERLIRLLLYVYHNSEYSFKDKNR